MTIIKESFSFDDLMLQPKYSEIKSRSEVNLSVQATKGFRFDHPIVPSNMKTIMGYDLAKENLLSGGLTILHRFMPLDEQLGLVEKLKQVRSDWSNFLGTSVGVKPEDKTAVDEFVKAGVRILTIDIAHGHSLSCIEMCKYISTTYPDVLLIAGNVATGEGAKDLWEAGADIVKCGIGQGCFGAGTRVLMSNGFYKNIEDINPGDFVINKNGKAIKVLNAFSTGIKKVSKLKNNSFYTDTYVTPNHQFWVGDLSSVSKASVASKGYAKILDKQSKTKPKTSKYKWKAISDAQNDILLLPKNIKFNLPDTFEIILDKRDCGNWRTGATHSNDSKITPSYDSGYLFGTFLGDERSLSTEHKGSHIGNVRWYFGKEELDVANKLSLCIKNIFDKDTAITYKKNIIDVAFYYKPLGDFLDSFGKHTGKHLPENLLVNNKKYLQGLYDGLMDSDGHYSKDGRDVFCNTSPKLIELFNTLNFILNGYMPNNSNRGKQIGGLKSCNPDNLNDAYISRTMKRPEYRFTKDYFVVKNLNYEELDLEMEVFDITVDCDTHSFIANNMVVHNSICTTRVQTGNGVPAITTLMDAFEARKELLLSGRINKDRQLFIMNDGGAKASGCFVKGLCFADLMMTGNVFAGCIEVPGETITGSDGATYKRYEGSSTHKNNHIEGVKAIVHEKGHFKDILQGLFDGIKSGCSYQGISNLIDLKRDPQFVKISNAGLTESKPHDVIIQ
jgi:IMP dehydrogenase/GMP reductase